MKAIIISTACVIAAFFLGSRFYYYSPFHPSIHKAVAVIHPTKGNSVTGIVKFSEEKDGLHIKGRFSGLTPGEHGFHVHEFGDCGCDDAKCAGEHYNPTHEKHGGPNSSERHIGDFGNIVADTEGNAIYELVDTRGTLNGPRSFIGRTLIVHAQKDDLVSQPSGNSGDRIGCGVIGLGV